MAASGAKASGADAGMGNRIGSIGWYPRQITLKRRPGVARFQLLDSRFFFLLTLYRLSTLNFYSVYGYIGSTVCMGI
jgi:hypothetical protein